MAGGEEWTWLEAYGLLEGEAGVVHGPWAQATAAVEKQIDAIVSREWMEQELQRTAAQAERKPQEILQRGSGWGALERRRREVAGETPLAGAGVVFDDASLGPDQQPWLELLEKGTFGRRSPEQAPGQFMVQPQWHKLLEDSVKSGRSNHWLAWFHLGVMRFRANPDHAGAAAAWEESVRLQRSGWGLRNLAVMARLEEKPEKCADLYAQAMRLLPDVQALAIECSEAQIVAGRWAAVLELQALVPASVRAYWRLQMLAAAGVAGAGRSRCRGSVFEQRRRAHQRAGTGSESFGYVVFAARKASGRPAGGQGGRGAAGAGSPGISAAAAVGFPAASQCAMNDPGRRGVPLCPGVGLRRCFITPKPRMYMRGYDRF